MPEDFKVIKVFNNNVLLAKQLTTEKILIKKGLGFGKKPGERIPQDTRFDQIFVIENREAQHKFNQLLAEVEESMFGVCEEVLWMIGNEVGEPISEEFHIGLIDHIAFTLYRIQRNDKIENPFIVEIETLYAREYEIAQKAVAILAKNLKVEIPESEIGLIALHIHSLRNNGKLSNTIKYAYICNSALELIEDELQIEVDRKSIDYARFVCHIRFAVERIIKGIPIKNELLASIRKTYKNSYQLAQQVAAMIEKEIYQKVPEAEIGFITMHVERIKNVSTMLTNG